MVAVDALRTFWEKVTLIHAACGKEPAKVKSERMSRHWYDLHMLVAGGPVDLESAFADETLLQEVVALKKIFYYAGSASYEHCLEGGLVLEPEQELLGRIAKDYDEMRDMNLVAGEPPEFELILRTVNQIQSAVNSHFG